MNHKVVTVILITVSLITGCKYQKEQTPPPNSSSPEVKDQIKVVPFIPPSDSTITLQQIKAWSSTNLYLDSLTILYSDSFKVNDPIKRMHYQEIFSSAQDKICAINGLSGGYKEYKWILNNIGNPKNKSVLDSAGISVH